MGNRYRWSWWGASWRSSRSPGLGWWWVCWAGCAHRSKVASDFAGPAYDLTFCEVRDTSLVMLWKAPVYSGSSPVSGYFVDFREEDAGEWVTVNQTTTANRYLKVSLGRL